MHKFISLFIASIIIVYVANAQAPKALVYGNFTIGTPQGIDFTKAYNAGNGIEIGGGIGIGKTMLIGITGYIQYQAQTANTLGDLKVIPIKVGIRRYLVGKLFVNGQVGAAIESYGKSSVTGTKFLYEVGAGVKILHLVEVGLGYTGYQSAAVPTINYNSLLFKVGFSIKL
jgi:hypothetical protein